MAKRKKNKGEIGPSRPILDTRGRAEWLVKKGEGHAGFDELLHPGAGKTLAKTEKLPASHPLRRLLSRLQKRPKETDRQKLVSDRGKHADRKTALKPTTALLEDDKSTAPAMLASEDFETPTTTLLVPIPSGRDIRNDIQWATRDGQADFRARIIAAYGACAVTGCTAEVALQAAHIIPYVDARSNITNNGLCLRADVHLLYDRNLILIDGDGRIRVSSEVRDDEYRRFDGMIISFPVSSSDRPDSHLLDCRGSLISRALSLPK